MEARCQCGAVKFQTPLQTPLALYICHCDECRRQTSSAFGTSAIFPRFPLPDDELLSCYKRPTASGQTLYCYFCKQCGTRLIHTTPGKSVVSVKGGCLDGLDWKKAIHIWTRSAMVPIPEGSESYSEESELNSEYSGQQEVLDQGNEPPALGGAYYHHQSADLRGSGGAVSPEHLEQKPLQARCDLSG